MERRLSWPIKIYEFHLDSHRDEMIRVRPSDPIPSTTFLPHTFFEMVARERSEISFNNDQHHNLSQYISLDILRSFDVLNIWKNRILISLTHFSSLHIIIDLLFFRSLEIRRNSQGSVIVGQIHHQQRPNRISGKRNNLPLSARHHHQRSSEREQTLKVKFTWQKRQRYKHEASHLVNCLARIVSSVNQRSCVEFSTMSRLSSPSCSSCCTHKRT